MYDIKSITITRAEGLIKECGRPFTANSFIEAQLVLAKWGLTAPKEGYDKVDFIVEWEDGETYSGRYDMVYGGKDDSGHSLSQHILHHLAYQAQNKNLQPMSKEEYLAIKRDKTTEEQIRFFIGQHKMS